MSLRRTTWMLSLIMGLLPAISSFAAPPAPFRPPENQIVNFVPADPAAALPPKQDSHFISDIPWPGSIEPLVENLRSTAFDKREAAEESLLRLPADHLSDIVEALAHETDPEAAERLRHAAMHVFLKQYTPLNGPASLLGIKLNLEVVRLDPANPEYIRMSVAVMELQPGFPAAQELKVGDRLIALDGKPFPVDMSIEDFRGTITARPPGSTVRLSIIRAGKPLELSVQLAGIPQVGPVANLPAVPENVPLVPNNAGNSIEAAIDQRNLALKSFVVGLKDGVPKVAQILEDHPKPVPSYLQGGSIPLNDIDTDHF